MQEAVSMPGVPRIGGCPGVGRRVRRRGNNHMVAVAEVLNRGGNDMMHTEHGEREHEQQRQPGHITAHSTPHAQA